MDKVVNEIIRKYWNKLKKKQNVWGYSSILQPRIKNGKQYKKQLCFRIYVTKKLPINQLKKGDIIPRVLSVSDSYIMTDIVEIEEQYALKDNPKQRHRPIVGGISSCHYLGTACTGNVFWKHKKSGRILYSCNNHCYALENKARIGDNILQPSPYDMGVYPIDTIGKLHHYVELKFCSYNCRWRNTLVKLYRFITRKEDPYNTVDIAFSTIEVPYDIALLNNIYIKGSTIVNTGDKVWKIGRTTGYTEGTVYDPYFNGYCNYNRGRSFFNDIILIYQHYFARGGDSGSPVMKDSYYIGALFAGSDNYAMVCKYYNIEKEGDVILVTS